MTLQVREAGLYTLVVDFGRPHSRSLGVPVGGAADRAALVLGNALVGNGPDAPALEFSLAGPVLEAGCELGCVVFGAPFEVRSSRQFLVPGKTFTLSPGEELRIGGTADGMRGYLCVRGGVRGPQVLDSFSGLGPLRSGMTLSCTPGRIPSRFLRRGQGRLTPEARADFINPPDPDPTPGTRALRVLEGLQASWFNPGEFYQQRFTVSPASNRMGLRLQGRPLTLPAAELVSEPVSPGAVQVTRDGQCIILGVDGQTIGGYPKMAQVISADLDRVARLRPGEQITFVPVGLPEAERLWRQRQACLKAWHARLLAGLGAPGPMVNP